MAKKLSGSPRLFFLIAKQEKKSLKILIFLAVLCSVIRIQAQTNLTSVLTTNFVTAAPFFREVNGQLYNTSRSSLWKLLKGRCAWVHTNYVAFYTIIPDFGNAGDQPGWNGWDGSPYIKVQIGEHEDGSIFLVRNFPTNLLNSSLTQSFRVFHIGIVQNTDGQPFDVWDYGKPHVVSIVGTNYYRLK
jgi:hypothetical protein